MKPDYNIIEALGMSSLPEADQKNILAKVEKRLEDIVMRVMVENLSNEEAEEMRGILKDGKDIEEKIAEVAADVPRLAEKLEQAVADEIEKLRTVIAG